MLKVTNLNYTVDGTQILHDVSLKVHPGNLWAFWGQTAAANPPC